MIVIVEGIDRVGKTTLCEKLKEHGFVILKDGIDILKNKGLTKNEVAIASAAKVDTTFVFAKQLSDQGVNVVLDRCHLTEAVYGLLDRGACKYGMIKESESTFAREADGDAILVLVEPTDIKEACERAGEDLSLHVHMFRSLFPFSTMQKLKTNFNMLDVTVKSILGFQEEKRND